jgi:hypothetical protein
MIITTLQKTIVKSYKLTNSNKDLFLRMISMIDIEDLTL